MDNSRVKLSDQHAAVLRAAVLMRDQLDEELIIGEFARMVFFSRYHFTRVFSKFTGLPPGRFLAELRILAAEDLLVNSDLSFTEITYRVGYTSVGTFSTRFKAVTGKAPSEYRVTDDGSSVLRGGQARRGDSRLVMRTFRRAEILLGSPPASWTPASRTVA